MIWHLPLQQEKRMQEIKLARHLVKGLLLALEVAEAATVEASTTTTATGTSTAAAKAATAATTTTATATVAKSSTATTTAASATTAEAAATTTATSAVVLTGSGIVDADVATSDILTVQSIKSGSCLLLGTEVDIAEALDGASVAICGQRDASDVAILGEDLLDALVGAVERKVTEEQGVAGSATLVTVLVGTIIGLASVRLLAGGAEVDVQLAAIELVLVHLGLSLRGISNLSELNVSEALGATSLAVGDDTASDDFAEALELAAEPILVNVPAHVANKEVLNTLSSSRGLSLGLLDGGLSGGLGLALLRRGLLLVAVRVGR